MKWRIGFWNRPAQAPAPRRDGAAQRRRHYRLPIAIPFAWQSVSTNGPGTNESGWRSAVSQDLSAGGLSFVAAGLEKGHRLQIRLPLPDGEIAASGEVVRVDELGDATRIRGERLVAVRLLDLTPRAEQQLVRYIFQVESSRRQLHREDS